MKLTPRIYAEALYEAVKAVPHKEIPKILFRFLLLVRQRRHWAMLPSIMRRFDEVMADVEGLITVKFTTAREHSTAHEREWMKETLHRLMALEKRQRVELERQVDPDLIGGFTMRVKDMAVDASVKGWLKQLRGRFTTASIE